MRAIPVAGCAKPIQACSHPLDASPVRVPVREIGLREGDWLPPTIAQFSNTRGNASGATLRHSLLVSHRRGRAVDHTWVVTIPKMDDVHARWSDDGRTALLESEDGSWLAHLRVEQWYADQELDPELAWIASWLDPDAQTPTMLSAAVERPALTADTPERQHELIAGALAAMADPPAVPAPFAAPAPIPGDADEWAAHLELQLNCWSTAFDELMQACRDTGPAADYVRYRTLTQALDWAYAMNSSLGVLWKSLPPAERKRASLETDERARKAAAHNAAGQLPFEVETDPAFAGYVRRLKDHEPYSHWGEVILAGIFQARFFHALAWVRGQLIHAATSAPMDLRQFRPGAEPRWKWRIRASCSSAEGRTTPAVAPTTGSSPAMTSSGFLAT